MAGRSRYLLQFITDYEDDGGGISSANNIDEYGSGSDDEDDEEFYDSGYEFEEDDRIFDSHVDHDAEMLDNREVIDHGEIPNEITYAMQNVEGDANCVDIDDLGSVVGPDDDDYCESKIFPLFDDAKNLDLKFGMILSEEMRLNLL